MVPIPQTRRRAGYGRVAEVLARLPSGIRVLGAALLLLGTAEVAAIARYGDGRASATPAVAMLVFAPLYAAGGALVLRMFGRLTHRSARMLGGSGDSRTTAETLVLLAALLGLPAAGAFLLWGDGSSAPAVIQLALAVTAMILGARIVAYLERLGLGRATIALVLPISLLVVVLILFIALHSALAPALPAEWRIR